MKKCKIFVLILAANFAIMSCKEDKNEPEAEPQVIQPSQKNTAETKATTLSFSGYTWNVRHSGNSTGGPDNNYWSSANVYKDANGYLHLKLTKDPATNRWLCSEVSLAQNLGYGTYQWKLIGRVDQLDHNVVFGLFNYSGNDAHDEQDIEFSKWGVASNSKILNYTVWPKAGVTTPANVTYAQAFTLTGGNWSTHRFKRTSTAIAFQSMYGHQDGNANVFASKTWTSPPTSISTLAMPIFMNLWCFKTKPPSNGQNVEIIIKEFKFTPL